MDAPDALSAETARRNKLLSLLVKSQADAERAAAEAARKKAAERAARPIWQRDAERSAHAEAAAMELKARLAAAEIALCPFSPAIDPRSKRMHTKTNVRWGGGGLGV